jgi:hypothetical protein
MNRRGELSGSYKYRKLAAPPVASPPEQQDEKKQTRRLIRKTAEDEEGNDCGPGKLVGGRDLFGGRDMLFSMLRFASQATMCGTISVFFFELYVYNAVYLRRILPAVEKGVYAPPFFVLFNSLWIMAFWSYLRAHLSDPGYVPQRWYDFAEKEGSRLMIELPRLEWQAGVATLCKRCLLVRPERAHHCLVCNACVLRMDHHCPWINNCVGFLNHKFFLLLTTYACVALVCALSTAIPEIALCAAARTGLGKGLFSVEAWRVIDRLESRDVDILLLFALVSLVAAAAVSSVLSAHVPLALRNITSIEENYSAERHPHPSENNEGNTAPVKEKASAAPHPFDQGGAAGNLAQVLGTFGPDWFLPIRPCRPLTDGIVFPRPNESLESPVGQDKPTEKPRKMLGKDKEKKDGDEWPATAEEPKAAGGAADEAVAEGGEEEQLWHTRYQARARPPSASGTDVERMDSFSSLRRWWVGGIEPV